MQKLYCYPRYHITDSRVSQDIISRDPKAVVVSISSTTDKCPELEELGMKGREEKCLRLKFDDIGPVKDYRNWNSSKAITPTQAEEITEFIENNLDGNFYIHCDAGVSRSQAIVRFILDCYGEGHDWETRSENPPDLPNQYVLWALKRVWRKKNYSGIEFEDD